VGEICDEIDQIYSIGGCKFELGEAFGQEELGAIQGEFAGYFDKYLAYCISCKKCSIERKAP
jgi:hypothetical protein